MRNLSSINVFYVYAHYKKTTGEIFYIGKGSKNRVLSKSGRNQHWKNIVKKHGFTWKILKDGMTNDEACALEIKLIKKNKNKLCNIAKGGESGLFGIELSAQHKVKLREAKLGKKQSPEHAAKSAVAKLGKKQPRDAVEKIVAQKRKPVINSDGEIFESSAKAAIEMAKRTGSAPSQGNISSVCRGCRDSAYGKTWSYDTKKPPTPPRADHPAAKKIHCENGMIFNSVMDAVIWVKSWNETCAHQSITACARGKSKTSYGYRWWY